MALFDRLKQFVQDREQKKRKGQQTALAARSFAEAKNIALLFFVEPQNPSLDAALLKFRQRCWQEGKDVYFLGFSPTKELPPELGFDCLCLKDQNWLGAFQGELYESFLQRHFDFLVLSDFHVNNQVETLAQHAQAAFRVGYYQEENPLANFDLLIQCAADKGLFLQKVEDYLKRLSF